MRKNTAGALDLDLDGSGWPPQGEGKLQDPVVAIIVTGLGCAHHVVFTLKLKVL